jgi:hypothetical protein
MYRREYRCKLKCHFDTRLLNLSYCGGVLSMDAIQRLMRSSSVIKYLYYSKSRPLRLYGDGSALPPPGGGGA